MGNNEKVEISREILELLYENVTDNGEISLGEGTDNEIRSVLFPPRQLPVASYNIAGEVTFAVDTNDVTKGLVRVSTFVDDNNEIRVMLDTDQGLGVDKVVVNGDLL